MDIEIVKWAGFFLSFLAAFLFSLFHLSLSSFSKIALSRFLEDKDKKYRVDILDKYDEIKTAVGFLRVIFLIAFLVYLFTIFPRLRFWPLWLFLISLGFYFVLFDSLPRLLNALSKKRILSSLSPLLQADPFSRLSLAHDHENQRIGGRAGGNPGNLG